MANLPTFEQLLEAQRRARGENLGSTISRGVSEGSDLARTLTSQREKLANEEDWKRKEFALKVTKALDEKKTSEYSRRPYYILAGKNAAGEMLMTESTTGRLLTQSQLPANSIIKEQTAQDAQAEKRNRLLGLLDSVSPSDGTQEAPETPTQVTTPANRPGTPPSTPATNWEQTAKTNPQIQQWWKEFPESKNMDIIEFMKNDSSNYDYRKAIESGLFPTWQSEHNQFRWSDIGKSSNFIPPNQSEDTIKQNRFKNLSTTQNNIPPEVFQGDVLPKTTHLPGQILSQEIQGKKIKNIVTYVKSIVGLMPEKGLDTAKQWSQGWAKGWAGGNKDVMAYQVARPTWGRTLYKNFSSDVGNIAENEGKLATQLMPDLTDEPGLRLAKLEALERASKQSMDIVNSVNQMYQTGTITPEKGTQLIHDGVMTAIEDAVMSLHSDTQKSTPSMTTPGTAKVKMTYEDVLKKYPGIKQQ